MINLIHRWWLLVIITSLASLASGVIIPPAQAALPVQDHDTPDVSNLRSVVHVIKGGKMYK